MKFLYAPASIRRKRIFAAQICIDLIANKSFIKGMIPAIRFHPVLMGAGLNLLSFLFPCFRVRPEAWWGKARDREPGHRI
jgi:hypothetical protein